MNNSDTKTWVVETSFKKDLLAPSLKSLTTPRKIPQH